MNVQQRYFFTCLFTLLSALAGNIAHAQKNSGRPDKISHAEPLYFDLVRDLGARKGEKELNFGSGFGGSSGYNKSTFLAEYEFAPVDHLGLEAEADLALYNRIMPYADVPGSRLECIRLSAQYSFLVSPRYQATLAAGYTQIVEFASFRNYENNKLVTGMAYNPFFIAAKRWNGNFHTLVYFSPLILHDIGSVTAGVAWQLNTSFHYTIPGTKNFAGIELNQEIREGKHALTLRPQVKVQVSKQLAIGLVAGLPLCGTEEHTSSFFRIIYEP